MIPARLSDNPAPLCALTQRQQKSHAVCPEKHSGFSTRTDLEVQTAPREQRRLAQDTNKSPHQREVTICHPHVPQISLFDPWMSLQMLA